MFSESLLKRLRIKQKTYIETIAKNGCATIEDYRFQAGIIKGLTHAINEAVELHRSMYEEILMHSEDELDEDSVI